MNHLAIKPFWKRAVQHLHRLMHNEYCSPISKQSCLPIACYWICLASKDKLSRGFGRSSSVKDLQYKHPCICWGFCSSAEKQRQVNSWGSLASQSSLISHRFKWETLSHWPGDTKDLSCIPGTHVTLNQLWKVMLWPPHVCHGTRAHAHIRAHAHMGAQFR